MCVKYGFLCVLDYKLFQFKRINTLTFKDQKITSIKNPKFRNIYVERQNLYSVLFFLFNVHIKTTVYSFIRLIWIADKLQKKRRKIGFETFNEWEGHPEKEWGSLFVLMFQTFLNRVSTIFNAQWKANIQRTLKLIILKMTHYTNINKNTLISHHTIH